MGAGLIGFSNPGHVAYPSPSIWGDCSNTIINDRGLGVYVDYSPRGLAATPAATTTAPGIEVFSGAGTAVIDYASSGTYGQNNLSMATGATDNNNTAIHGEEVGRIIRNSGQKFWFEARVAAAALGDTAFFVGLATRAGARTATTGLITNDPSNSAGADIVAVTNIGFLTAQSSSAIATVDAVYAKTTGSPVTVLANVTNATALQAYQAIQNAANPGSVITQAAGVTAQTSNPIGEGISIAYGNLVAASFRKFGIKFDGRTSLDFYVDGVQVASQEVDSTIDQTSYLVPVIAAKNGASTALTMIATFMRAAWQARG